MNIESHAGPGDHNSRTMRIKKYQASQRSPPGYVSTESAAADRGVGSGFIVNSKGCILKTDMPIEIQLASLIGLQSGEKYGGKVIGVDPKQMLTDD